MSLLRSLLGTRSFLPITMDDYVSLLSDYGGLAIQQTLTNNVEEVDSTFPSLLASAYKGNGIIFACMLARQLLFSEARFQFRQLRGGTTGDLFGTEALVPLERPWRGATTGDLLSKTIQYADLLGNAFVARRRNQLKVMRPDWVTIVIGSRDGDVDAVELDAEVIGYIYHPGGRQSGYEPVRLLPEQVAHFAPIPDPATFFRGMSWITPVVREVMGDSATTEHKLNFFRNGATPNMVVSLPESVKLNPQTFREWVEAFDQDHKGVANAYKTIYLAGGADATVVGANLQQLDFKVTQGAGETRIAAASGIHPVILAFSEGMQGSSLNTGNFNAAKRLTADKTLRPLWRNFCGSMESIITPPPGSQLWYDDRDIPFLAEDVKDAADVQRMRSETINRLITAGYKPDAVINAVEAEDLSRLAGQHTGLFSVQLQPPGTETVPVVAEPSPELEAGRAMLQMALAQRSAPMPQLTIEEGAFRIESPVTVEPTQITFPEGFVRSETTVEPAQVTIEKGAVQVDAPVTVEPAQVTIEEGAMRVDSPVTVEPAQVTIAEGAIRSDSPITVHTPDVTIEEGAIQIDSPTTVNPAQVRVEPTTVRNEDPTMRAVVDDLRAAVDEMHTTISKPRHKVIERDEDGRIIGMVEE